MNEDLGGLVTPKEAEVLRKHGVACGESVASGKAHGFISCPDWASTVAIEIAADRDDAEAPADLLDRAIELLISVPDRIAALNSILDAFDVYDAASVRAYLKEIGAIS